MMKSRKQKRLVRYIEEGNLLKLKSYLRKHKNVELDFCVGKRRRSVLHLACAHRDDAVLRLLLKHGADPLQKDRRGGTALHAAAELVLQYGRRDYEDLVVPLSKHCPAALDEPNHAGVTPRELLSGVRFGQSAEADCSQPLSSEEEWREKLYAECQDEFCGTFGKYDDDDFLQDDEDEDFGKWADRIKREYQTKQQSRTWRGSDRRRKSETLEDEGVRRRRQLEKEHMEYLQRAHAKEEEVKQGKKRRYEERCAATFHTSSSSSSSSSSGMLAYNDIPWPAPRGSPEEMVAVMLHGVERSDTAGFRRFLRRQQALWHPDKFAQRFGERLQERDRQRVLETVLALSQELNRHLTK